MNGENNEIDFCCWRVSVCVYVFECSSFKYFNCIVNRMLIEWSWIAFVIQFILYIFISINVWRYISYWVELECMCFEMNRLYKIECVTLAVPFRCCYSWRLAQSDWLLIDSYCIICNTYVFVHCFWRMKRCCQPDW